MPAKSGPAGSHVRSHPSERRRWKRFQVDGAFASVPNPSLIKIRLGKAGNRIKLGPIKDIGMKGLAVQYAGNREIGLKNEVLSVVMPSDGVTIEDITYTTVSDFEVTRLPNSPKSIRTLCVCFNKLLPIQKARLEYLIEHYGVELRR
jgi:hypothetical protein